MGGRKYQHQVLLEAAEKRFPKQRVLKVLASIAQQLPHAMEQLGGPPVAELRSFQQLLRLLHSDSDLR